MARNKNLHQIVFTYYLTTFIKHNIITKKACCCNIKGLPINLSITVFIKDSNNCTATVATKYFRLLNHTTDAHKPRVYNATDLPTLEHF